MLKSIKKSIKYLAILIGILVLTPSFFYVIIRIPEVQTFIVKRISGYFSDQIRSTISIGRLEYSFFNKLTINDLLIKDVNNDTMFYSRGITVGLRKLDFRNKIIILGQAELTEPSVALITDSTGMMNLKWYLNLLGGKDSTSKGSRKSIVEVNQLSIKDGSFQLRNMNGGESKMLINFNNLVLKEINTRIADLKVQNDSVSFKIRGLDLIESNGLRIQRMSSNVVLAGSDIIFEDLFLSTDSSVINADHVSIRADSSDAFQRFIEEVRLDVGLQKSMISSADLRYFLPSLDSTYESLSLSGKVSGTISELKGRNIRLDFGSLSELDCDFDLSGLPRIKEAFIYVGVHNLKTRSDDLENISIPGKGKLEVPEVLKKIGTVSFNGSFTGFINDFVAYGKIASEKGDMKVDVSLRPEEKNKFKVKGLVKGSNIDLGYLSGRPDLLGKVSMETNLNGNATSAKTFSGTLTGNIDSIEINKYVYRNIGLSGVFTEKTWDGSINVSDRNVKMDLLGMFDFSDVLPEFDFTLNLAKSNLHNLNFDKTDTTAQLAMLLTANFKGNNIDNLYGEIKMLNSTFKKYGKELDLYDFSLKAFTENNKPAISLRTDFADADLRGYYNFGEISKVLKKALSSLMPSRFPATQAGRDQIKNNFVFTINFKNTDKINNFFKTGLLVADKSRLNGSFFPDSIIRINLVAKKLTYKNNTFNDLTLNSEYSDSTLTTGLNSSSFSILGKSELKGFNLGLNAKKDNLMFHFDWDNKEKNVNKGSFVAHGSFLKKEPEGNRSILKVGIDSSDIYVNNRLWKIAKSDITIDSGAVDINKFVASSRDNYYLVDGNITANPSDTLHLKFKGIDLSVLNQLGGNKENKTSDEIPFNIKGIIDGNILISHALDRPLIESNVTARGFSLLGGNYGDVSVTSGWNSASKVADINARNNLNGIRNLDVRGYYDPATRRINLTALTSKLDIDALNPLLGFFASGITGTVSGRVTLTGEFNKPVLRGALKAENTSMKINYLQTRYTINDTIRFDNSGIKFRNIKMTDEKGKTAVINGSVNHKYFKDFVVDLTINMNNCLVLNTQAKDNELFYGTAYATGVTTIKSGTNSLSFDISGKTEKNTRVFIPLNSGLSVSEYSFVSFVKPDTVKSGDIKGSTSKTSSKSSLELNIDLDVTPEAEVQLLIDPKAGDVIKGKGAGELNINLNKAGEFKITGDYTIAEGDYLFTLGNIINKRFDVESGSKITFNGDVEKAEIDLKASYKNLRTSLYPILGLEQYSERISVEPQINLTGNLFNPLVSFDIYLPNADEEVRSYLRNAITTEEELNRQFLFLLVMNSFYAGSTGTGTSSTFTNESIAGNSAVATTTEMLSNQLSNWLSQISNDFDIGFIYKPGFTGINSQEVQVALSTQLLNDKVLINGNFDVRGANNSMYTAPITGDFDIEYKLTDKIRFKVFNRFNNPYEGHGNPYTQGLGIFYKQDFNKFSDLFNRKEKPDIKKEEEIIVK